MDRPALWIPLLILIAGCTGPLVNGGGDLTGPGDRAADYLKPRPYASILVELDYLSGSEPEPRAVTLMEQRLEAATGKPVEVVRTAFGGGLGSTHRYTRAEVEQMEARSRGQYTGGTRAVLHVMYLDGSYEADTSEAKTLAAAYRGSSVVAFKANLREASRGNGLELTKPPIQEVEESVLVHEIGHILGLVNLGTPMVTPHEDPQHPKHSRNQQSVMYYAVETSLIGSILGQNPPDDFDADDKADLRAMRGS